MTFQTSSFETVVGPKDPAETVSLTFPFAKESVGATCLTATVEVEVLSGYDSTPPSMLFMDPDTSGFPIILQSVTGGMPGVVYLFRCVARLSSGQVLVRKAVLAVCAR